MPEVERLSLKFGQLSLSVEATSFDGEGDGGKQPTDEATSNEGKKPAAEQGNEGKKPAAEQGVSSEGASSTEKVKPTPTRSTKVPKTPEEDSGPSGFYVLWSVPEKHKGERLLGVHQCTWKTMCKLLPGGSLAGSGCCDCKKFASKSEAVAYYYKRHKHGVVCEVYEYETQD